MKLRPVHVTLILTLVILGMVVAVTGGDQPGSIRETKNQIVKTVSRVEPNASATFDIVLQEGGDAAHESTHIFGVLEHPSIATLTLDTDALTLTVAYDSSGTSEGAIREALAAPGYVQRSIEDAVAAETSADGASQTVHLTPGEALDPPFVRAKAGLPLVLTFSAGEGHLASVSIPDLGLTQDLTVAEPRMVIDQPAAGTYELVCAEGYTDATLVVE